MNRKPTISIVIFAAIALLSFAALSQNGGLDNWTLPTARVNVGALDELGNPLAGVSVRLVFCKPKDHTALVYAEGSTDEKGLFAAEGYTDSVPGMRAQKEGYYLGVFPISGFTNAIKNRWQPWDATYTSIFRKVENPIPMYARRISLKLPHVGEPCGYDLKESDWVSPWGKGLVSDFVFTMNCGYTNFDHQNVSMKLTFSNPSDGIQPANLPKDWAHSMFIWHRQAPETGYVGNYQMEFGLPDKFFQIPGERKIRTIEGVEALKYYFRVRTVVKDGQIVGALYGKLSEGFFIGAMSPTNVNVQTCYYLNPMPLDRNMEFDLKKNLFKKLPLMEQPRRP